MSPLRLFRNLVIFAVVVDTAAFVWGYNHPLPQPALETKAAHEALASFNNRHVEHITLHTDAIGDIGLAVSLPDPLPQGKMPILMVLGGLDTGEHNIHNIVDAGNNVIAGFDWPMPVKPPNGPAFLSQAPEFYSQAMIAPAQIATAIHWLTTQSFADQNRISILGYSMGALAAPAAQELTQQMGHNVGWTIIAYGGAPLETLLAADPHIKPAWMREALVPFVSIFFHPLEPDRHLPNLTGHFLILEGKNDGLIPEAARKRLRDSVPEPKTIVTFEGDHMGVGPEKAKLLEMIIAASREWLIRMKAVNPL